MRRTLHVYLFAALFCGVALRAQSSVPEIPYNSVPNLLKLPPNVYLGEVPGAATDSKGNIFVYTRTGSSVATEGTSRTFTYGGAQLFQFGPDGKYIREIGAGVYGFLFAHMVRVDAQDNIWVVDQGANMIIKFNPEGRVVMALGRKPESIVIGQAAPERGGSGRGTGLEGDNFAGPTDVAWDAAGNIFVADGFFHSRIVKFDKDGKFIRAWGSKGSGPSEFKDLHSLAIDAQGLVYAADRNNGRIQVFHNNGDFKTQIENVGRPGGVCISPGPHQYLYSSNITGGDDPNPSEVYKLELDGKVLGKFGKGGKLLGEFGPIHGIDCRFPNQLFLAETTNWRVQKIVLH